MYNYFREKILQFWGTRCSFNLSVLSNAIEPSYYLSLIWFLPSRLAVPSVMLSTQVDISGESSTNPFETKNLFFVKIILLYIRFKKTCTFSELLAGAYYIMNLYMSNTYYILKNWWLRKCSQYIFIWKIVVICLLQQYNSQLYIFHYHCKIKCSIETKSKKYIFGSNIFKFQQKITWNFLKCCTK